MLVECCVVGVDSAIAAEQGGADRVELCEHMESGGLTPSAGAIDTACRRLSIAVHVLIRPRTGDFVYSNDELAVMLRDIEISKQLGARGVVIGALNERGGLDLQQLRLLIAAAHPLSITFHRAFDHVADQSLALESLVDLGVARILTSGGARTAREGLASLESLQAQAANRVIILAAGRIRTPDIAPLRKIGIQELHVGSAIAKKNPAARLVANVEKVRRFVQQTRKPATRAHAPKSSRNSVQPIPEP